MKSVVYKHYHLSNETLRRQSTHNEDISSIKTVKKTVRHRHRSVQSAENIGAVKENVGKNPGTSIRDPVQQSNRSALTHL